LIIGNEGLGIPEEIMEDQLVLKIEQYGVLRSLNAAVAASIAMYQFSVWMYEL
jgi:tRNA G18 (ribose-2'-O)-methylase SpoU